MNLTTVREIYRSRETYLDKEVQIGGWVRSVRGSKNFGFIVVSDGSYFETFQVVYHDTMPNFAEISKLNVGASIIVKGTLVATPEAKQPFEIQATDSTVSEVMMLAVLRSERKTFDIFAGSWYTTSNPCESVGGDCVVLGWFRLSPIDQYSSLLPPVGVWTVSQFQCGGS